MANYKVIVKKSVAKDLRDVLSFLAKIDKE